MQFLAHIDYLRALAIFTEQFESVVPRLQASPCIEWVQARHPLLQQSLERHGKKMIPLDVTLRTVPNSCSFQGQMLVVSR